MWDIVKEIAGAIVGVFGFWVAVWKFFGKKWYEHYKANRDQWRVLFMGVQKEQNDKLEKILKQLYPNGGESLSDQVYKILDNQVMDKSEAESVLFMDETPIVKSNMDGQCTFVNLAYLRMCGFETIEEALGTGAIKSVYPDDRERVTKEYTDAFRFGKQLITSYRKINLRTDEVFPVTATLRAIINSKGERVATVGVLTKNEKK